MRTARLLFAAVLVAPLLGPSIGCEIIKTKVPGMNPADRLPPPELQVGGGREIDFTAPGPGLVIYANRKTGTTLKTVSVETGQKVSFEVDLNDPNDPLLVGQDPYSFDGVLFFKPEGYVPPPPPADIDPGTQRPPVTAASA